MVSKHQGGTVYDHGQAATLLFLYLSVFVASFFSSLVPPPPLFFQQQKGEENIFSLVDHGQQW
jgi:hypothetical protein